MEERSQFWGEIWHCLGKFCICDEIHHAVPWESDEPLRFDIVCEKISEELWFSCFLPIKWVQYIPLIIITEEYSDAMSLEANRSSPNKTIYIKNCFNMGIMSLYESIE